MNRKPSIRFLLVSAVSLGVVLANQLPFASRGYAAAEPNLKRESQLKSEAALLRRVAERLKQAAAEIRPKLKTHHAVARYRTATPAAEISSAALPTPGLTKGQQAILLVGVAVLVCSPLLPALVTVSQAA